MYSGMFVKAGAVDDATKDWSIKISDADLLDACEGRTARKGARFDQHGKITRADEGGVVASAISNLPQEKVARVQVVEPEIKPKKVKKVKKEKKSKKSKKESDDSLKKKKKKRKHRDDEEKTSKKKRKVDCDGKLKKKKKSKHEDK
jgi:hypothetical protein